MTRLYLELSTVVEDKEPEDADTDFELDQDQEDRLQSPGTSEMSGTTALISHSQYEIDSLDIEVIEENLETLSMASSQLLRLLTPEVASEDAVERIVKELQIPGSTLGRRLNLKEQAYESYRAGYGNDVYIDATYILRKLFPDGATPTATASLLPIIQEANIAKLVKTWLVAQQESREIISVFQYLDENFPTPFLIDLEDESEEVVYETLDFALEIRTQRLISLLKAWKDTEHFDPDGLLALIFFRPPAEQDPSLSAYEDSLKNGQFRPLAGVTGKMAEIAMEKVKQQIEDIRIAFLNDQQAAQAGELVDFDELHEAYPWIAFLTELVEWSQSRVKELRGEMKEQGGIQNMVESLKREIHSSFETEMSQGPELPPTTHSAGSPGVPKQLQPPAEIFPTSASDR